MEGKTVTTTINVKPFPEELWRRFKIEALRRGTSIPELLTEVIETYLAVAERPISASQPSKRKEK